MTLGADKKKLAWLALAVAVMLFVLYLDFSGDSSSPGRAPAVRTAANVPPAVVERGNSAPDTRRRSSRASASAEIKFRQGFARPEDRPDPATINPTLRLDLLAKLQKVLPGAAMRNLFQYGTAVPVAAAGGKPIDLPKVPKIAINQALAAAASAPTGPPSPPQAPPMTFKYYGYKMSKIDGRKQAFLLDGDDIIFAEESDVMKSGRYKIVNIGVNSITIEDTQFKSNQTLPLQMDANV